MKYTYTNEKGEKSECGLEKWAWGVVYRPTDEQIEAARVATKQMREDIIVERNRALKDARERNAPKETIQSITDEYNSKVDLMCAPKQDELKQFTADGVFHKFAEIDQSRVQIFTMFRTDDEKMLKRIDIEVQPGMQLFHFYRKTVLDYMHKENSRTIQVYVFGWKSQRGEEVYHFILPDDRIITTNKKDIQLLKYQI